MIYVGTCGYGYEDWQDVFYPSDVPRSERLAFYASEFDAVELDFTYYRMPTAEHLDSLAAQVTNAPEMAYAQAKEIPPCCQARMVFGCV